MEENHRRAIVQNVQELSHIPNFEQVLDQLIKFGIYTKDMVDHILANEPTNHSRQAQKLFLDIQTRGPKAFKTLYEVLTVTGNFDVGFKMLEDSTDWDKSFKKEKFQIPLVEEDEVDTSSNSSTLSSSVPPPLKKFKSNDDDDNEDQDQEIIELPSKYIINSTACQEKSQSPPPLVISLPEIELCVFGSEKSKITVVPSNKLYSGNENVTECYKMNSHPRGLALIVNNIEFIGDPDAKRNGAEYDSVNLKNLWEQMGYKVTLAENITKDKLLNYKTGILSEFIKKLKESKVDSCIISLNSHGFNRDLIRMSDPIGRIDTTSAVDLVSDIICRFNNRNFPDFHGKPKVFLVNACRGSNSNRAVRRSFELESCRIEGDGDYGGNAMLGSEYSDIFVLRSTVPEYVSLRDLDRGTWFVECLCNAFATYSNKLHFSELKSKVGKFMEKMYDETNKLMQSCHYEEYGITKSLYFNPGL